MAGKEIEKDKKGEIDIAGKGDLDISPSGALGKKDLNIKDFRGKGAANTDIEKDSSGQVVVNTNLEGPSFDQSEQGQAAL
ncbi:MAG: hypothetical protein ACD_72C00089G0001, partial [uncultured bacterium]